MAAIIIIIGYFEKNFMVLCVFFSCVWGIIILRVLIAMMVFFLFVLFTSLFTNEAVYINRVIIPDENVMIMMYGSHLLDVTL